MGDARDKAIAAIKPKLPLPMQSDRLRDGWAGEILDAIPSFADLAIERGEFVQADVWDRAPGDPDRVSVYYEDEQRPDDAVPLYRRATEDET